jgi:cytoskeletal protein CcmA (bactofilin family)
MGIRKYLTEFKNLTGSNQIDTTIGTTVVLHGPISSKKDIKIDGKIAGGINTKGNLFIGPNCTVDGDLIAKNITICGKVNGNAYAKGRIIVTSRAMITGNISMSNLVVDEGGTINGICRMHSGQVISPGSVPLYEDKDLHVIYEPSEKSS